MRVGVGRYFGMRAELYVQHFSLFELSLVEYASIIKFTVESESYVPGCRGFAEKKSLFCCVHFYDVVSACNLSFWTAAARNLYWTEAASTNLEWRLLFPPRSFLRSPSLNSRFQRQGAHQRRKTSEPSDLSQSTFYRTCERKPRYTNGQLIWYRCTVPFRNDFYSRWT